MPESNVRVAHVAVPFAVPIATLNSDVATNGVVVERVTVAVTVVTFAMFVCALGFSTKLLLPNTLEM
jgi:hypothetical protein